MNDITKLILEADARREQLRQERLERVAAERVWVGASPFVSPELARQTARFLRKPLQGKPVVRRRV